MYSLDYIICLIEDNFALLSFVNVVLAITYLGFIILF